MKTIKQVEITHEVCEGDIPDNWKEWRENHILYSPSQKYIGLKCLCGCEAILMLPVNQHTVGWRVEIDDQNRFTLIGSIPQYNCGAHYIITKNKANFV